MLGMCLNIFLDASIKISWTYSEWEGMQWPPIHPIYAQKHAYRNGGVGVWQSMALQRVKYALPYRALLQWDLNKQVFLTTLRGKGLDLRLGVRMEEEGSASKWQKAPSSDLRSQILDMRNPHVLWMEKKDSTSGYLSNEAMSCLNDNGKRDG